MEDIKISEHAIDQFIARTEKSGGNVPNDPERAILKLLSEATEEKMDPVHRVKRLLTNNLKDCSYHIASGWRFVVAEGSLVTCERVKPWQN